MSWKEFEQYVADIFRANDFRVKQNFRFKTRKRYEIDLIAVSERHLFCVDCKQWSGGRYKTGGLKTAAAKQARRVKELEKFLRKNILAQEMMDVKGKSLNPLIVTQMEEDLIREKGIWVVPVEKLNSFLLDSEQYIA